MSKPVITKPLVADNKPIRVELGKCQEYHFCSCGYSKSQPICDGSYAGTSFTPKVVVAKEAGEAWLCTCKDTANPPFCDGSHKQFSDDDVGKEGPGVIADRELMPKPVSSDVEPRLETIHQLAEEGLSAIGAHGQMAAMGVPGNQLPAWDEIQIMVAQMDKKPLLDEAPVDSRLVIGPDSSRLWRWVPTVLPFQTVQCRPLAVWRRGSVIPIIVRLASPHKASC